MEYAGDSSGVGGQVAIYKIKEAADFTFESDHHDKLTLRMNEPLAMKHNFCEHIPEKARNDMLGIQGIFGMDIIRRCKWRLSIEGTNYVLDIKSPST